MPITEKQREARRKRLGGSDLPEIMLDVGNAHAVYCSKVYETEDFANPAMEAGSLLEVTILNWAEQRLGKLLRNQYRRVSGLPIGTNIDSLIEETGEPVEGKSTGIVARTPYADQFGLEGTDEVPERVIIQTHCHMMATEKDVCHVPTLIGGRGFLMFRVERNGELVEAIAEIANRFWTDHVLKREPPDESWSRLCAPSLDILKRVRRKPGKIVPVEPSIVDQWQLATVVSRWIRDKEERAKARVLDQLGDAEAGQLPDGRMVTYKAQRTGGIYLSKMRAAHPKITKEFEKTTTHRVLRITKGESSGKQLTGGG